MSVEVSHNSTVMCICPSSLFKRSKYITSKVIYVLRLLYSVVSSQLETVYLFNTRGIAGHELGPCKKSTNTKIISFSYMKLTVGNTVYVIDGLYNGWSPSFVFFSAGSKQRSNIGPNTRCVPRHKTSILVAH